MSVHHPVHTNGVSPKIRNNNYQGAPLIETLTNGFFVVDNKWTVKYWNKAAEKLLDMRQSDVMGKNLWEKFAKLLPVEFYAVYQKAFLKDIPVHFHEYWSEMGAWFDVITWYGDDTLSVSFKSSKDPNAKNPEYTEQRLNKLTELYKYVTEITNDCLWEWDLAANEIFWIDGGHKRVFGYPIENRLIPQRFWESCIHPDDKIRVLSGINKILTGRGGSLWEDKYRFKKADGEYVYVHDRGHILYGENNKAARIIGATQDINERVLQENEMAAQKIARQREITSAVLMAQENERAHIGRELHDNLGQILAVAKMYLQMAKKAEKKEESSIDKPITLITEVIEEIRKISKELVIPARNIIGLFDSIKNLVKDVTAVHPLKIEFQVKGITEDDLNVMLQITIYRIIQEQLNNILKHSKASLASITLKSNEKGTVLVVADNGKGHILSKQKSGVGMINIKSRVELYQGSVSITSQPGRGYKLKAIFPLVKV